MTIVTTHYRYKRPPRKRKAVALEVPAIVTIDRKTLRRVSPQVEAKPAATDGRSPPTSPPASRGKQS